jgi:hypothetical protein
VWNHRVCKNTEQGEIFYNIHEVYYDDDGKVEGWTQNAVAPLGNDLDELRNELKWMLEALDKPILDLADELLKVLPSPSSSVG